MILDELDVHQPLVTDFQMLKGYREDLVVSKFLPELDPLLVPYVVAFLMVTMCLPSLLPIPEFYKCSLDVGLPSTATPTSFTENSVMSVKHNRGHGRRHNCDWRGGWWHASNQMVLMRLSNAQPWDYSQTKNTPTSLLQMNFSLFPLWVSKPFIDI